MISPVALSMMPPEFRIRHHAHLMGSPIAHVVLDAQSESDELFQVVSASAESS